MAAPSHRFETTLWSQVLLAAREPDSDGGRRALARLCNSYWYPIYAFIRRQGVVPEDAADLTQGFFAHILASDFFARADPQRGRFRSFLLGAVSNFVGSERERQSTQRRGGRTEKVAIDAQLAEEWLASESSSANDSTKAFDRSWAIAVISAAMDVLEREQAAAGRSATFDILKEFLQRAALPGEYENLAVRLGMSRGAMAAAVHRLNERFGELVRKSVRDTVSDPEMAEDELRALFAALRD